MTMNREFRGTNGGNLTIHETENGGFHVKVFGQHGQVGYLDLDAPTALGLASALQSTAPLQPREGLLIEPIVGTLAEAEPVYLPVLERISNSLGRIADAVEESPAAVILGTT